MSKKYENKSNILKISNKEYLQKKEVLTSFFLNEEYVKMTEKQVANFFNVPKDECYILDKIISELEEEGVIYQDDSKRLVRLSDKGDILKCTYSSKSEKFGFCLAKDGNDVYISKSDSLGAINGDDVLVRITKPSIEGKTREGIVLKILKHNTKFVIGTFVKSKNFGFVVSLNDRKIPDIYIPKKYAESVKDGSIVKVEILKYATSTSKAEGKIISIIGNKDDENIEIKALYKSYGLDTLKNFSKDILDELDSVPDSVLENEKNGRVDRTSQRVYTIDGEDAKDLDDGVFVRKNEDGKFVLSVYIADVSHYVKDGTALDNEAIARGTSIYIPGTVIPMLPKKLSNGICSLNEGVERLSLAIDITYDEDGNVISSNIFKAVIKVTKRMSYEKVYCVLNGKNDEILKEYMPYKDDIFLMRELAQILNKKRVKNVSINFDLPETKVVLDDDGNVVCIKPYEKNEANNIIEEFMLAANMEIAKTFFFMDAPFIYRIHEKPDEERLRDLNTILSNYKIRIKGVKNVKPKTLADILLKFENEDDKEIISNFMLRSLKLAKYSENCEGHFGLAAKFYCHFTSPIRRYPDLFIHRVISDYIDNNYILDESKISRYKIQAAKYAIASSEAEKNATAIERDFDVLYETLYMKKFVGEEFEAKISSITSFGMFVKLENSIEVMVPFALMPGNDYYDYDENKKILVGIKTGKIYKIGDKVKVVLEKSDPKLKQIDFSLK